MKRKISFAVIILMLSLLLFGLTACGEKEAPGISFKTLTVNGNNVYGKVSNDTTYYSFIDEISTVGGADYIVSRNVTGTDRLPAKSVDLVEGDNTVYIIEMINDEPAAIYTVVIRRRPVYTVTFDANGGSSVKTQYIEEECFATVPEETTYAGYTFTGWDYDFSAPVMSDTNITASWEANTDTKYTVEYYLENLDKSDYELVDTDELTGTTDTTATAEKIFEHFTLNPAKSVASGNINGNGSLVLKVYYTRNQYKLSNANTNYGSITKGGTYNYGETVTTTATVKLLGYEFTGWYSDGKLISKDATYTFTVDKNLEAKFAPIEALNDFYFTSTATTCEITGIKNGNATDIVIPDCVTSIGDDAFDGCPIENATMPTGAISSIPKEKLKTVVINGGATISNSAFYNCTSLTSVIIGNSVTSIGEYAFDECTSLTSVTIGNSVTSIGIGAFEDCTSLTSVTIPDSVILISEGAFYDCYSLTSVTIGNSVTSIGEYAFDSCSSLTSVTIGNSVTSIGSYAFFSCDSLTSVTIPDSVTSIGERAFYSCDSLTSVTIPDSVTSIGNYAFAYCTSLTSVTFPDSVTSIGHYAFYGCYKLVEVINLFSLNITAGSDSYGYVGYYAIEVHNGESKIVNYNDYLFYTYSGTNYLFGYVGSDTELDLPESYNGEAYEIYKYAFSNCRSLTSVIIPDSVTSISNAAFDGCSSLTSVTIPNSVTSIGSYAFNGCSSLTSVIIPDSVTSIGSCAFIGCSSLASVNIPDSVTSIGSYAFSGCTSLVSVTIPDSVTSIGNYAFRGCTMLTIYCESESQPSGWNSNWNVSNRPVVWGYKAEE